MKNFKDIVQNFDKVISAEIKDGNSLKIIGVKETKISELEITYSHSKVAKEVRRLVQYFI
jgi:hypothetical protein